MMRKSASLPCFLVARLVKFTFIATISLSDFDFKLYKLSLSENTCFVDFFQEILIELSTVDASFGTSCKHATCCGRMVGRLGRCTVSSIQNLPGWVDLLSRGAQHARASRVRGAPRKLSLFHEILSK